MDVCSYFRQIEVFVLNFTICKSVFTIFYKHSLISFWDLIVTLLISR